MEMPILKDVEWRLLQEIQAFYSQRSKPPTMAELVVLADVPAGVGSVKWYCDKLGQLGLLEPRARYEARSLLVSDYGRDVLAHAILEGGR